MPVVQIGTRMIWSLTVTSYYDDECYISLSLQTLFYQKHSIQKPCAGWSSMSTIYVTEMMVA